jgi:hypothetical protein
VREIDFVFFDIGGMLGDRDPVTKKLVPYPSSAGLLKAMRNELKVRVGIITTLGGNCPTIKHWICRAMQSLTGSSTPWDLSLTTRPARRNPT